MPASGEAFHGCVLLPNRMYTQAIGDSWPEPGGRFNSMPPSIGKDSGVAHPVYAVRIVRWPAKVVLFDP